MFNEISLRRYVKDFVLICMGVSSAVIGLKCFLLPNHFLDGGATGVSLLVNNLTSINISLLIIIINIPFVIIGAKQISLQFAVKSTFAILSLAFLVHFVSLPVVTADKLLIAIFGGFFLGAGIGLSIRGSAVIDGSEVLAIAVSRKTTLSVGDFIALFNATLFAIAAFLINIETAMYSMLTYLAASKTVDFLINGIEEYIGVTIVSDHSVAVKQMITQSLGLGVTVYDGTGGYGKSGTKQVERKILFCVVTRLEVSKLLLEIDKIDENCFIIQQPVRDTRGGIIKKRPLH
jgi:uncharacterized membrane-anchored protein YitT (DUF2179 family)